MARELEHRSHTWENISYGIRRFLVGLAKKVILADNFALLMKLFRETGPASAVTQAESRLLSRIRANRKGFTLMPMLWA